MLKFEIDNLKEAVKENPDALNLVNNFANKASELNDFIYPDGYTGVIENPIITFVNNCAKLYVLALTEQKLKKDLKSLEEKRNETNASEIDKQIEEVNTSLSLATEGVNKCAANINNSRNYINKNIADLEDEKKVSAQNKFKELDDMRGQLLAHKFEKKENEDYENMSKEELIEKLKEALEEKKKQEEKNAELEQRLEQLEQFKEEQAKKKDKSILSKLKNGFKTIKKKVVKAKNFVVNAAKNHKVATVAILTAVAAAGIIGSCVVYNTPLAIPARIVSALWQPLHHIGLGAPLHSINNFLVGVLGNGSFNNVSGVWTIGSKVVNNMNMAEVILGNMAGAGILYAAGRGIFKGVKKGVKWIKGKRKKEKEQEDNENEYADEEEFLRTLSDEKLAEFIKTLEEILSAGKVPEEYNQYSIEELNDIYNIALAEQGARGIVDGVLNNMTEEECEQILKYLKDKIETWDKENTQSIGVKIGGVDYMFIEKEKAIETYQKIEEVYNNKFGGRAR